MNMAVQNRIRHFRELQKLTIEQLAEMAGVSVSYLSRMETGARNVSVRKLEQIAKPLGIPASVLIAEPGSIDAQLHELGEEDARRAGSILLTVLNQIPKRGRIGERTEVGDDLAAQKTKPKPRKPR